MNLRQLVERGDRPFATQPQVTRYFPAASIEDARQRLARAIERGDGPGVVIGGAGIGKSLLLQVLAAQYREKFDVVLLACAQLCTRRALLQAIHFELGLDYRRRDEGELRLSLMDTLLSADDSTQGLLLLVDEAQALATHLLEELRLLTNLSRGGAPGVRLVMAGLPSLEEKLASPELQSFSQRLAVRSYLAPMSRVETTQYIRAQLAASQADPDRLVDGPAFDAIFTASDGVPRLVNQVCDRALVLAVERGMSTLDATIVQAAWSDLQQLPSGLETPIITKPTAAASAPSAASIVEFGALAPTPPAVAVTEKPLSAPAPVVAAAPTKSAASAPAVPAAPPAPPKTTPLRRPRVFSDRVPEAIDPFAEVFEEEELVLESFATLASIFGTRTPRVENSREPAFSRLVQHVLEASDAQAESSSARSRAAQADEPAFTMSRPAIRLAVVNESTPADAAPPADDFEAPRVRPAAAPAPLAEVAKFDDFEDTILIIEDDPTGEAAPQSGVRREGFRQLFTRLRHGT